MRSEISDFKYQISNLSSQQERPPLKTVITDYTFPDVDVERAILQPAGCEVVGAQCTTPEELIEATADADFVITQFAPVNAAVIEAMERARIIVRYGIGVDNVDLAAAASKDVPVCNVPDYCIDEVADHALSFMLACTRCVLPNASYVADGHWGLPVELPAMRTLADLTVGIVGFGRIGREVLKRLSGFRATCLVFDPVVDAATIRAEGAEPATLEQLLGASDIVTLHCPANEHTHHLINRDSIAQMKSGAILINVSRGALVENGSLAEALTSGKLSAAALDVTEVEPLEADSPLRDASNLFVHSHVASCSIKANTRLREAAATLVVKAINGEALPNIVNGVKQLSHDQATG